MTLKKATIIIEWMKHPNTQLLSQIYSHFQEGRFQDALNACSDKITFQIAGKSRLAGKYTKANFISDFTTKLNELSHGSFKLEVHDILAGDLHAAVLCTSKLEKDGKPVEMRTVHVWRLENGVPIAWYEYPRDLYQFDSAWG